MRFAPRSAADPIPFMPKSVFRNPPSVFRVFRIPYSVFRVPQSAFPIWTTTTAIGTEKGEVLESRCLILTIAQL
jgi:hypothetical protein